VEVDEAFGGASASAGRDLGVGDGAAVLGGKVDTAWKE